MSAIPKCAFAGCSALTDVTVGGNVTSIGTNAFAGCGALATVTFAEPQGWQNVTDSTDVSTIFADPANAAKFFRIYPAKTLKRQ